MSLRVKGQGNLNVDKISLGNLKTSIAVLFWLQENRKESFTKFQITLKVSVWGTESQRQILSPQLL